MEPIFYKKYQRDGLYNFYKLEGQFFITVNFLNSQPIISQSVNAQFATFNVTDIIEGGEQISEQEFQQAWTKAVAGKFRVMDMDGKECELSELLTL